MQRSLGPRLQSWPQEIDNGSSVIRAVAAFHYCGSQNSSIVVFHVGLSRHFPRFNPSEIKIHRIRIDGRERPGTFKRQEVPGRNIVISSRSASEAALGDGLNRHVACRVRNDESSGPAWNARYQESQRRGSYSSLCG